MVKYDSALYHRPWVLVQGMVRAEGGRETERFRGIANPTDRPNGAEAWIGSVISANGATKDNPYVGRSEVYLPDGGKEYLFQVIADAPDEILGRRHIENFGQDLGILLKLLDAKAPFLLQCHPTRRNAELLWGSKYGKTECWHVLSVRDDNPEPPYILLGFKPGITAEHFKQSYHEGKIDELEALCHKIAVKPGETYFVPAGMPHALGSGCFVVELQEPSDSTAVPIPQSELIAFRQRANPAGVFIPIDDAVYDERTLKSFDYTGYTRNELLAITLSANPVIRQGEWGCVKELIGRKQTDYFSLTKIEANGDAPIEACGDIALGLVTEGEGMLTCDTDVRIPVRKGSEIFFPYDIPNSRICGNVSIMLCRPTLAYTNPRLNP